MILLIIDSLQTIANTVPTVKASSGNMMLDYAANIMLILVSTVFGGGYLWKIIKERQTAKADFKKQELNMRASPEMEELNHGNSLETEKFNFDKQKYIKRQDNNEAFQKEIINRIFDKFVTQTEWITKMYESKLEELMTLLAEANKTYKDVYVQMDVLNNRVRNMESKLIKNTNISIAKIDTIVKIINEVNDTNDLAKLVDILNIKLTDLMLANKKEKVDATNTRIK